MCAPLFFFVAIFFVVVCCLDNGLGRTPQLGWNSWSAVGCQIDERIVLKNLEAAQRWKLRSFGYQYFNLDDCIVSVNRTADGKLQPDLTRFPRGLAAIADAIHEAGFLAGLYSDRGTKTCAGRAGSEDHYAVDAATWAEWGFDYLKMDSCNAPSSVAAAKRQYAEQSKALNQTGRPIFFSLCGWKPWYANFSAAIANSWRISGDADEWNPAMMRAVDVMAGITQFSSPGGWNDPDLLAGSSPKDHHYVSQKNSRAQFTLWAVFPAPLLISARLDLLSIWDLETFTNRDLLAVNQDPLGAAAQRVAGGDLMAASPYNIWAKRLSLPGQVAVAVLNNNMQEPRNATDTIHCNRACWQAAGLQLNRNYQAYDLWTHEIHGQFANGFSVLVERGGSARAFQLKPM